MTNVGSRFRGAPGGYWLIWVMSKTGWTEVLFFPMRFSYLSVAWYMVKLYHGQLMYTVVEK